MTQQASLLLGLLKHAADSVLEVRNTTVNSSGVPEFPCGIIKFLIQLVMLFCLPCSLWISWTSHHLKVLSGHCNISARDLLNKEGGRELLTVAVFSSGSWAVRSSLSWVSARPSACTYVSYAQFSDEN
jgi:hypothetical protein